MRTARRILSSRKITNQNDSREHLIQNSIGGRKRVRGVLCTACNSTAGDGWDAEFARQLQPLSSLFAVSRQRGDGPSQVFTTVSGQQFAQRPTGQLTLARPSYEETETEAGTRISIS